MSQGTREQNGSSPESGTSLPRLSDAPSGTTTQDHLGFGPYAEALAFLIDWRCSKPPLTVAISGPWGAGKTSLARLVQEQLKTHGDWDDDHIICEFSAWKHDDAPNLGAAFAAHVAQSASEERHWWRRLIQPLPSRMLTPEQRWRRQLYVILASLAVAVGLVLGPDTREIITAAAQPTGTHWINAERAAHGFGLTLIVILAALAFIYPKIFSGTQAVARFINDPKSEAARGSIDSVSKQLGGLIASATRGNRRFVVFVEDLERCRPPRAVDVCEVVSQLLDHDDVATVLVGDMDTIARSAAIKYRALEVPNPGNADMEAYEEYGRSYMEKLVQLQFDLPPPPEKQLKKLRKLLSSDSGESIMQPSGFAAFRGSLKAGFRRSLKMGWYALIVAAGVAVTAVAYYSLTHLLTHARLLGMNVRVILVILGAGLAVLTGISPIADIRRRDRRRRARNKIDRKLTGECSGMTISRAVETISKSDPSLKKESVRRRYFNLVFDSDEAKKARNQMLHLLDQFLPKEPRAIKKFAFRMRLVTAIGIAHGVFKFQKGKVPKLFVDRFGKWLVLLDKWPSVSLISQDGQDGQDAMAKLETAADNSTSEPLQEELRKHGLSDTDDIEGLRKLLVMDPRFGDVSQLVSVSAASRKAARPG